MSTALEATYTRLQQARIEQDIRDDFINRYNVLTKDQEGVSELLGHLGMDFSFFLACFVRNPGKVESTALRDYIMREAEELAITELEQHPEYGRMNVRGIIGD